MYISEVKSKLEAESSVAIVGIESHICVMQTTLDLLKNGHKVYVLKDGVSSCNPQEIPVALSRMQQAGAVITTSESWLFDTMGDAAIPQYEIPEPANISQLFVGGYSRIYKNKIPLTFFFSSRLDSRQFPHWSKKRRAVRIFASKFLLLHFFISFLYPPLTLFYD